MTNLNTTSTYKYQRENGTMVIGYVLGGTLDGGDYGVSEVIDILMPNDKTAYSIPVSKLVEIDRSEYMDLVGLNYGIYLTA